MAKSDTMLGYMGQLVRMQKAKIMQDLSVPHAEILKTLTINIPNLDGAVEEKEGRKRNIVDAQKIVAAQLKKVKLVDDL